MGSAAAKQCFEIRACSFHKVVPVCYREAVLRDLRDRPPGRCTIRAIYEFRGLEKYGLTESSFYKFAKKYCESVAMQNNVSIRIEAPKRGGSHLSAIKKAMSSGDVGREIDTLAVELAKYNEWMAVLRKECARLRKLIANKRQALDGLEQLNAALQHKALTLHGVPTNA